MSSRIQNFSLGNLESAWYFTRNMQCTVSTAWNLWRLFVPGKLTRFTHLVIFRSFLKPSVLRLMRVGESPFGCWQNLRSNTGFRKTFSSSFIEVLITVSLECSLRLEWFLLLTAVWQPSRSENSIFRFQLLNATEHFHRNYRFSVPNVADI
jgi:hypothetical protein